MSRIKLHSMLALLACLLISAAPAPPPEALTGLTAAEREKLLAGEIVMPAGGGAVENDKGKLIRAALVFDQPIEKAWAILSHPENEDLYLDECSRADLIERKGNRDLVEFEVSVTLFTIVYRIVHHYQPEKFKFYWNLDPEFDNDLNYVYGEWQLYRFGNRTIARYATRVDVSSVIPDFIQAKLAGKDIPISLAAVRSWINSGGKAK
jgi:hypothetical protein